MRLQCPLFVPRHSRGRAAAAARAAHLEHTRRAQECEAAVNEQICIEYTVSYVYHSLYSYFDRDNVGLPGFAAFFKAASDEEREHAELLMDYQTRRGGRVKLQARLSPPRPIPQVKVTPGLCSVHAHADTAVVSGRARTC